jgi:hypothetical protein
MNVQLDSDTARLVERLGQVRAAIANHRLAGLVNNYSELDGIAGDGATPCSPLVTIRAALQRELARNMAVARDIGLTEGAEI